MPWAGREQLARGLAGLGNPEPDGVFPNWAPPMASIRLSPRALTTLFCAAEIVCAAHVGMDHKNVAGVNKELGV